MPSPKICPKFARNCANGQKSGKINLYCRTSCHTFGYLKKMNHKNKLRAPQGRSSMCSISLICTWRSYWNTLNIILKYPKCTENYTRIPKTNTRNTKMILKYLKHWKLFSTQNTLNVILNNNLSVYLIAQFLQCNATGITQQLNCTWCRKAQRSTKLVVAFHVFLWF